MVATIAAAFDPHPLAVAAHAWCRSGPDPDRLQRRYNRRRGTSHLCQQATSISDGGSVSGDRKLKESPPRLARGRPPPAPGGIDDPPADRESHTHAAGFGGEEGGEQLVRILGGDPDAAIRHTYQHLLCLVLTRSDHQFALPIRDRLHRFNAIYHQVNDYLLQLDPITKDHG